MNTYRNLPKKQPEVESTAKRKSINFDIQWDGWLLRTLPYIIYVAFFGIIYIANRHYTERNVRQITKLKREVEELRVDYTTLNAVFMQERNEDNMIEKARKIGLGERNKTQYKIKRN